MVSDQIIANSWRHGQKRRLNKVSFSPKIMVHKLWTIIMFWCYHGPWFMENLISLLNKTPAKNFTPKFRSKNHSFLAKMDIFHIQLMKNVIVLLKMSDFMNPYTDCILQPSKIRDHACLTWSTVCYWIFELWNFQILKLFDREILHCNYITWQAPVEVTFVEIKFWTGEFSTNGSQFKILKIAYCTNLKNT